MAMPLAPGASVPAGAGDLAVAAAFAFGAESEIGGRAADADGSDEGEAPSRIDSGTDFHYPGG